MANSKPREAEREQRAPIHGARRGLKTLHSIALSPCGRCALAARYLDGARDKGAAVLVDAAAAALRKFPLLPRRLETGEDRCRSKRRSGIRPIRPRKPLALSHIPAVVRGAPCTLWVPQASRRLWFDSSSRLTSDHDSAPPQRFLSTALPTYAPRPPRRGARRAAGISARLLASRRETRLLGEVKPRLRLCCMLTLTAAPMSAMVCLCCASSDTYVAGPTDATGVVLRRTQ